MWLILGIILISDWVKLLHLGGREVMICWSQRLLMILASKHMSSEYKISSIFSFVHARIGRVCESSAWEVFSQEKGVFAISSSSHAGPAPFRVQDVIASKVFKTRRKNYGGQKQVHNSICVPYNSWDYPWLINKVWFGLILKLIVDWRGNSSKTLLWPKFLSISVQHLKSRLRGIPQASSLEPRKIKQAEF